MNGFKAITQCHDSNFITNKKYGAKITTQNLSENSRNPHIQTLVSKIQMVLISTTNIKLPKVNGSQHLHEALVNSQE